MKIGYENRRRGYNVYKITPSLMDTKENIKLSNSEIRNNKINQILND